MNTDAYNSLMGSSQPTAAIQNQSFLSQNRIGGPSSVMISGPGTPGQESLEDKYKRLYDQYYDVDKGMFDLSGVSSAERDYFNSGLQQDIRKRDEAQRKKEQFFSGAGGAGMLGSYNFPSSQVQQARQAQSAI